MPLKPEVDGEFYIDNVTNDFFLRENAMWDWKGRLVRANVVGFYGEGPFLAGDRFELAISATPIDYGVSMSEAISEMTCEVPPSSDVTVVFTDDLAAYLGRGERAICTGVFTAGTPTSNVAALTFTDAHVAAGSRVWLVLPNEIADPTFAGLHVLIAGEPA